MKKQLFLIIVTSLATILLLTLTLLTTFNKTTLNIKKASEDVSTNNLNKLNYLSGEWEFFPNKLIASLNEDDSDPLYVKLPKVYIIGKSSFNHASYRLYLEGVPLNTELKLNLLGAIDGYAIYFNRKLVDTNYLLTNDDGVVPLNSTLNSYVSDSSKLEIIIEISSNTLANVALTKAPTFSKNAAYTQEVIISSSLKAAIVGIILFISLYQFIVIGLRNKEKGAIFFSLLMSCAAVEILMQNDTYSLYFNELFSLSSKLILYASQISSHLISLFLFLSLYSLYQNKRKVDKTLLEVILFIIPIILILSTAIFKVNIFASIINVYSFLNLINIVLIVYYAWGKAKKQELNNYIFILTIILLISVLIDYLIKLNILPYTTRLMPIFYIILTFIYSSLSAFIREREMTNVEKIVELNDKIRDTEFAFLNSQIRSHFIYNSLNSIQSLINTNPAQATSLIEDFSSYLRTRLEFNKMPHLVNFEDELENIRTYLNIEKVRFGKRVNYVYDLKVGGFLIPPLSVQPLVENAVKHGISMRRSGGIVTLATYQDENNIYISVRDNGVGFDPNTLDEKQRVGTENIRHRLYLHLEATLSIYSVVDKGTESVITIPKKRSSKKN